MGRLKERAEAELRDRRVFNHLEEGRRADVRIDERVVGNDVTRRAYLSRQLASSRGIAREFLRGGGAGPEKERERQEME
jgi:hypothetical protein